MKEGTAISLPRVVTRQERPTACQKPVEEKATTRAPRAAIPVFEE
jgi:hypothetical protein